jgi:hypothetical protein
VQGAPSRSLPAQRVRLADHQDTASACDKRDDPDSGPSSSGRTVQKQRMFYLHMEFGVCGECRGLLGDSWRSRPRRMQSDWMSLCWSRIQQCSAEQCGHTSTQLARGTAAGPRSTCLPSISAQGRCRLEHQGDGRHSDGEQEGDQQGNLLQKIATGIATGDWQEHAQEPAQDAAVHARLLKVGWQGCASRTSRLEMTQQATSMHAALAHATAHPKKSLGQYQNGSDLGTATNELKQGCQCYVA